MNRRKLMLFTLWWIISNDLRGGPEALDVEAPQPRKVALMATNCETGVPTAAGSQAMPTVEGVQEYRLLTRMKFIRMDGTHLYARRV